MRARMRMRYSLREALIKLTLWWGEPVFPFSKLSYAGYRQSHHLPTGTAPGAVRRPTPTTFMCAILETFGRKRVLCLFWFSCCCFYWDRWGIHMWSHTGARIAPQPQISFALDMSFVFAHLFQSDFVRKITGFGTCFYKWCHQSGHVTSCFQLISTCWSQIHWHVTYNKHRSWISPFNCLITSTDLGFLYLIAWWQAQILKFYI